MATDPMVTGFDVSRPQHRRLAQSAWSDYWALTKPEVNLMIVITTFAGFYLAVFST